MLQHVVCCDWNPACLLAEWPSSTCGFVVTGNPALSLLLLPCGFVVTRNPAFSLAEQPSSPKVAALLLSGN